MHWFQISPCWARKSKSPRHSTTRDNHFWTNLFGKKSSFIAAFSLALDPEFHYGSFLSNLYLYNSAFWPAGTRSHHPFLLKVRPVGNEVPGRREHKEVRITLEVPQQEIMNSSKLSTFFLQLLERFRKGLINDHGVGEVVRELHRIYNRESHNIPLNEKDLWSIQRDLLNGFYEFSPFKKVVEVTFPSFSGHPIYDSILQFTYGAQSHCARANFINASYILNTCSCSAFRIPALKWSFPRVRL